MKPAASKPTCIDLFCGCGGFSLGLQRAGFSVLAAIDFIYAPCSPGFESVRHQDGVKEQRLSARTRWMERS